jgi:hypothetical protein
MGREESFAALTPADVWDAETEFLTTLTPEDELEDDTARGEVHRYVQIADEDQLRAQGARFRRF